MSNAPIQAQDILAAIIGSVLKQQLGHDGKLPKTLRNALPPELVSKVETGNCGDPTCEGCNPMANPSSETPSDEMEAAPIKQALAIPPEVAELVGLSPEEPDALENRTRAIAAALIVNLRELGAQPANDIKKALVRQSGLRYAEDSVLAAIHTFNTLAAR